MILRIMGEGQLELSEDALTSLNELDEQMVKAIESGDEESFKSSLDQLLERVRSSCSPVADDFLGPSDYVLPSPDATLEEVRELLGEEGLLPG